MICLWKDKRKQKGTILRVTSYYCDLRRATPGSRIIYMVVLSDHFFIRFSFVTACSSVTLSLLSFHFLNFTFSVSGADWSHLEVVYHFFFSSNLYVRVGLSPDSIDMSERSRSLSYSYTITQTVKFIHPFKIFTIWIKGTDFHCWRKKNPFWITASRNRMIVFFPQFSYSLTRSSCLWVRSF